MLFLLYTYLSFCLGEDRCSVFLFWLRCALTFGELSIWREILERFSWHHFSLMYFKLHFLLWHGVHLKVGGGKDSLPSCILVIGYVISSWFYGWLYISQREGDVISAVSRSKAPFTACSHTFRVGWWNLPSRGISFGSGSLHILFNQVCALNVFKGRFGVKLFWMDGLRAFRYAS